MLYDDTIFYLKTYKNLGPLGGSVGGAPTSAQVLISWFMSSSPVSGSVLRAQSLEPVLDSVSSSFSLFPSPTHTLSLSLSQKINIKKKFKSMTFSSEILSNYFSGDFPSVILFSIFSGTHVFFLDAELPILALRYCLLFILFPRLFYLLRYFFNFII